MRSLVAVDFEHLDGDLVAHRHRLARMADVLPGELGHVDQAVHAAQVHEGAEVHHRGHHPVADFAGLQPVEERLALLGLLLFEIGAAGQHHVVAVLVELDHLGFESGAYVGLQVAHPPQFHQRGGQEAAQADVHDEAALDHLDDLAGDGAGLAHDLFDPAPGALVLGALLGEDEPTLLVLDLQDHGLDALAHLHDFVGVDVVADRKLVDRDDPLGLEADVHQHFVGIDPDHGATHQAAFGELHHGALHGGGEVLGRQTALGEIFAGGRGGCLGSHLGTPPRQAPQSGPRPGQPPRPASPRPPQPAPRRAVGVGARLSSAPVGVGGDAGRGEGHLLALRHFGSGRVVDVVGHGCVCLLEWASPRSSDRMGASEG